MFNTKSTTTVVAVALATVMLLGAFAAPAAAVSSVTVTAPDDGTGATTTHTVSFSDDTDTGDIDELTIDYAAGDVSDVTAADATVTWNGTDQSVANVEAINDTTLTVTLDSAYTLDGATSETANVELAGVTNPENTGDYSVDVTLTDTSTSTDLGPASGTFTVTQGETPSVTSNSTLSEGSTVTYNADASQSSTVQVQANTSNLELQVWHDGAVVETYGSGSTAFTEVTAATTSSPGTYEFNVTQDAYSAVGVDYNETTDVTLGVENLDADAPTNKFGMTLDNQADRSQIHVSSAEINSPNVLDVTTQTEEPWLADYRDVENETTYEVSATRGINGSNSTVSIFSSDTGVSEEIDAATEDAEAGDIIHGLALTHDEGVTLISYDERADHVEDGDSYAVYDSSTDQIEFVTGDEYADASTLNVTFATMPATDLDGVDVASVASAYDGSELGIRALSEDLGWFDAFRVADSPFSWEIPTLNWGPLGDDTDDSNTFVLGHAGV